MAGRQYIPPDGVFNGWRLYLFSALPCSYFFFLYLIFSSYILKVNKYFDLYYYPRNSVARKHIHFKYISVSILINKMLIFLISYASDVNFYAINKTKSCGIMIKILKHIHFSILSHIKSRKL